MCMKWLISFMCAHPILKLQTFSFPHKNYCLKMKNAHLIHTCAINIVQRHVTGYVYGYVTRAYIQTTILGSESDGILCHAGTRKR